MVRCAERLYISQHYSNLLLKLEHSWSMDVIDAQFVNCMFETIFHERWSESHKLIIGVNISQSILFRGNSLPYKMIVHLDMLGLLMIDVIRAIWRAAWLLHQWRIGKGKEKKNPFLVKGIQPSQFIYRMTLALNPAAALDRPMVVCFLPLHVNKFPQYAYNTHL